MKFTVSQSFEIPSQEITFSNYVTLNLQALDRLINHSNLSYRRIAEILGVSELEMVETLHGLAEGGEIKLNDS